MLHISTLLFTLKVPNIQGKKNVEEIVKEEMPGSSLHFRQAEPDA